MRLSEMAVAIDQHHGFKPFSLAHRCRLPSFTHLDCNISLEFTQTNNNHLAAVNSLKQAFEVENIHRSFSTPCLSVNVEVEEDHYSDRNAPTTNNKYVDKKHNKTPRVEIVGDGGSRSPRVRALVVEVAIAMASGVEPLPVSSGLGGAYILQTTNGENIAVVKPIDEEPLAFNNPKGFAGLMFGQPGIKRSVRVGETGIREMAAYLLDHHGFAGVPPTALVKISHLAFHVNDGSSTPFKIASLQRFVHHDFDAGELGSSVFSVSSVHRIGIFDVRLLNLDRHAGNLLVKKQYQQQDNYPLDTVELVPIDHGLCLPEFLDDPYFEWLHWPQASVPFTDFELEYISELDPYEDADFLRSELPSLEESSIRVLIVCTIFLKRAAAAGLCLADIGEKMTRELCTGEENFSVLESLCAEVKTSVASRNTYQEDQEDDSIGESKEENDEVFQLDEENEATLNHSDEEEKDQVSDIDKCPLSSSNTLTQRVSRLESIKSMPRMYESTDRSPLCEDNGSSNNLTEKDVEDKIDSSGSSTTGECEENRVGGLTRSMSCNQPLENYNESGCVCFGDMSNNEWEMFLEKFERLLPKVLEDTKCMGLKQRLGTSCKF